MQFTLTEFDETGDTMERILEFDSPDQAALFVQNSLNALRDLIRDIGGTDRSEYRPEGAQGAPHGTSPS